MPVRHYSLVLTTDGLVHVGDGSIIGKKDYFLKTDQSDGKNIAVLNTANFIAALSESDLESYCNFLEESSRRGLQDYLDEHSYLYGLANENILYSTNTKLTQRRGGGYQFFNVASFVKDVYGYPYVPGSSVKGALRTALLCWIILKKPDFYLREYNSKFIEDKFRSPGKKLEKKILWVEYPDRDTPKQANDIMRYVSVSDSKSLPVENLVFAKKFDFFSRNDDASHKHNMGNLSDDAYYQGNELNIYRECLEPNETLAFNIDIDSRIDSFMPDGQILNLDTLEEIISLSYSLYQQCFLENFELQNAVTEFEPSGDSSYFYIGGGTDYAIKTIMNALFYNSDERVNEIAHILYSQFPSRIDFSRFQTLRNDIEVAGFKPRDFKTQYKRNGRVRKSKDDHRHWQSDELGIAPHTLKLGVLGEKKYFMGRCKVRIEER